MAVKNPTVTKKNLIEKTKLKKKMNELSTIIIHQVIRNFEYTFRKLF